ncbi:MAG: hypothetical protein JRN20_13365 [Nitrososphaerota archaeon]|nr:hypothetical protein [Nitrososphaerota archaeon]
MTIDSMEGRWRRELDDIHESMCQLGFLSGRLLGPTEADEAPMETLFQWTINFEGWILDRLWTRSRDFKLKDALLLLMRLNTWRIANWAAVGEQGWGGLENVRRQDPQLDASA